MKSAKKTQLTIITILIIFIVLRFVIEFLNRMHVINFPSIISLFFSTHKEENNVPLLKPGNIQFLCDDPKYKDSSPWCQIKLPEKSYFRFPFPPTDPIRWKLAQNHAIQNKHILLERVMRHFPNSEDFLDGDVLFRKYHQFSDYFLDENYNFEILGFDNNSLASGKNRLYTQEEKIELFNKQIEQFENGKNWKTYSWSENGKLQRETYVPKPYPFYHLNRVPIFHIGYMLFAHAVHNQLFFSGRFLKEEIIDRPKMLKLWKNALDKNKIQFPWIGLHSANENWGLLSTYFPNRTTNWGSCCSKGIANNPKMDPLIFNLLKHPMTIMFLTNQHHNITHPKLITLPRGIPIHFKHGEKLLHDSMHRLLASDGIMDVPLEKEENHPKDNLLFTSSSNWGYRPKIIDCIHQKFLSEPAVKWVNYNAQLKGRLEPKDYYINLGRSLFTLALPGLGYDTFRLWETLTIGSIPIIEKGVGFDKSLWKLPALIVEDFDEITPELLRTAYLEALYHADDFEFERLKQSWWLEFIFNVSLSKSSATILTKFPLEAEDPKFTRPFERFTCHQTNSCGYGTKRIPKSFC